MNLEFKARLEDNVITFIYRSLLKEKVLAGRSSAANKRSQFVSDLVYQSKLND
jgi:hypothetical protein